MRALCSFSILMLGLALAAGNGCGGDRANSFSGTGASSGADAGGGSAGSGGNAGTTAGSAGTSGGSAGTGGSAAGSGGSAGDAGSCAPPSDSTRAALCLTLQPEDLQFEADPRLDGSGILVVDIFTIPQPDGSGATPLAQLIHPPQPEAGPPAEVLVTELSEMRFDNLPPTVYVRAFFADNFEVFAQDGITWGLWIGGYNLVNGLEENLPLQAVPLTAGAGRAYQMPLFALRRLRATLTLAPGTTPLDDGEGPGSVVALRQATPAENEPIYGASETLCADLKPGGNATFDGLLIGPGTFYLAAGVDDYNLGGSLPPGALLSLEVDGSSYSLPETSRVEVPTNAYSIAHTIPLNFVVPLGDAGTPAPYACPGPDAGSD